MLSDVLIDFSRAEIVRLRTRALREGFWFRAITRMERICVNLVIQVVRRVRSLVLKNLLSAILKKIVDATESDVQRLMRTVGTRLALKRSQLAQSWGNSLAVSWVKDELFARYLTVSYMNSLT